MTGQFKSIMTGFPATSGSHRVPHTCNDWCYPDFEIACIRCRTPEG